MEGKRGGAQLAAAMAHTARAVARILRAAAAGGAPGAALAAVKEALPALIRAALTLIFALMLLTALVAYTIPSILFGFHDAPDAAVADMTDLAARLGGTVISLEDFENTLIDAQVTRLVTSYEENGTIIGEITVESDFSEDDLIWFIAIQSVSQRQDLRAMSAGVQSLCSSRLRLRPNLFVETASLTVTVSRLDPEAWMESLSFTEEDKSWAIALHDLMVEGDFLQKYGPLFVNTADYSGDSAYTGGYAHGGSFENAIDTSSFVDPSTKNNLDLVTYVTQAWENNWGYVWGSIGNVLTPSLFEYKLEQYPEGVGNYEDFIRENWLGRRTADCIGLIKGYGWFDPETGKFSYAVNGVPDYGANDMYCTSVKAGAENGAIADMPEIPGLILWKRGHTGVYIGGGYAIEAMGTKWGVVKTEVDGRGWEAWYKLSYLTYYE